jgi:hypothetical protein
LKICGSLKLNFFYSDKDPKRKTLAKELEDEENLLKQSIEKLRSIEASRVALVSLLKEALHEQVSDFIITFSSCLLTYA